MSQTEITVTATKQVSNINIMYPTSGNAGIQGVVDVVLNATEPYVTDTVASSMQVIRLLIDVGPEVQAAVDTLVNAILAWELEDNPA